MKLKETKLKSRDCLACHCNLDAATCISDAARPKPGDLTMCIYCGHMMAFAADLDLRELNAEESEWCANSQLVQRAKAARKEVSATHPDRKRLQ